MGSSPGVLAQVEGLGYPDPQVEAQRQHKDGHQYHAHNVELPAALEGPPRPFALLQDLPALSPFHRLRSLDPIHYLLQVLRELPISACAAGSAGGASLLAFLLT